MMIYYRFSISIPIVNKTSDSLISPLSPLKDSSIAIFIPFIKDIAVRIVCSMFTSSRINFRRPSTAKNSGERVMKYSCASMFRLSRASISSLCTSSSLIVTPLNRERKSCPNVCFLFFPLFRTGFRF